MQSTYLFITSGLLCNQRLVLIYPVIEKDTEMAKQEMARHQDYIYRTSKFRLVWRRLCEWLRDALALTAILWVCMGFGWPPITHARRLGWLPVWLRAQQLARSPLAVNRAGAQ